MSGETTFPLNYRAALVSGVARNTRPPAGLALARASASCESAGLGLPELERAIVDDAVVVQALQFPQRLLVDGIGVPLDSCSKNSPPPTKLHRSTESLPQYLRYGTVRYHGTTCTSKYATAGA